LDGEEREMLTNSLFTQKDQKLYEDLSQDSTFLPLEAVSLMGLPFRHDTPANLADNSEVLLPVHEAIILWDGEEREVPIVATGRRPLLGTALLDEQELVIQFIDGGLVTIEEL
jgi:clan AA aspartic protease